MPLQKDSEIKLAKVDGTVESDLIKKMKVSGYPTLFYYREGEYIRWELFALMSTFLILSFLCWILPPIKCINKKESKVWLILKDTATFGTYLILETFQKCLPLRCETE